VKIIACRSCGYGEIIKDGETLKDGLCAECRSKASGGAPEAAKPDVDQCLDTAMSCLQSGNISEFKDLLREVPAIARRRSRAADGHTLLLEAVFRHSASNNLIELIPLLIQAGADVNARARDGRATFPLLEVCSYKSKEAVEIAQWLIDAGAAVNMQERVEVNGQMQNSGPTPLHVAIWHNNTEVIKLLVSRGAALQIRDLESQGTTPLNFARYRRLLPLLISDPRQVAQQIHITLKPLRLLDKVEWKGTWINEDDGPTGTRLAPDIVIRYDFQDPGAQSGKRPEAKQLAEIREVKCNQEYGLVPIIVPKAQDGLACCVNIELVIKHGSVERGEGRDRFEMGWSGRSLDFLPRKLVIPLRDGPSKNGTPGFRFHEDDQQLSQSHSTGRDEAPDQPFAIDMTVEIQDLS
jgi:hypothetical protein